MREYFELVKDKNLVTNIELKTGLNEYFGIEEKVWKLIEEYRFNPIPTLREYFELVKDKNLVTNIELKTGLNEYFGIEEKVWKLIEEYKLEDRVLISSFNHYSVLRMKNIAPNLKYGLLTETWIINAGKYTEDVGVKCYHPHFLSMTAENVKELKEHNIEINVYTVNEEKDIRDMIEKGIDIVIGNYPDLTKKILEDVKELKEHNIEINVYTVNEEKDIRDMIEKGIDIVIGNYPDLTKKILEEYR